MPKKVIPFGSRILVKRRRIGDRLGKEGIIIAPKSTGERPTDIADVHYVPEYTLYDKELIESAQSICRGLSRKASEGDSGAVDALIKINNFLKSKTVRVGDTIVISKYVGVDFNDNAGNQGMTLLDVDDVIGLVVDDE